MVDYRSVLAIISRLTAETEKSKAQSLRMILVLQPTVPYFTPARKDAKKRALKSPIVSPEQLNITSLAL